jgi:L-ascorbate metabolism protein UlaG (beta-lactamase superfamily)
MDKSPQALKAWAARHLRWYRQSAFRIRTDAGQSIFLDPWRVPAREGKADLILVTHPHRDHLDHAAIEGLRGPQTELVLPRSCARPGWKSIQAGETLRIGAVTVTAVPAYNVAKRFHPRSEAWIGYLVEVDGLRVYHAGDTDVIPEMDGLRPDIALLPVGGLFAMNGEAAEQAAAALDAAVCIPMHFGMLLGGRKAGERFVRRLGERGLVLPRS